MSVKLYADADFYGQSKEFFGSLKPNEPIFYPISSLYTVGNDSVSSLIIGRFLGWTNGDMLNNDISSIKVEKGYYAAIYDKEDFTGDMLYITQNTPRLSSLGWDNIASAVSVYTLI